MLSDVVGVIQTALAPVFLLAGTAAFLSVYTGRLARLADRVNEVARERLVDPARSDHRPPDPRQLKYLRRRTLALEIAVILATLSGLCTCLSILALLGGAMGRDMSEPALFWFFGAGVASLLGSFVAFLFEISSAGLSMILQIYSRDRTKTEM